MLVIDPWLLDLGVMGGHAGHVAAVIGRCQFRTSRRLGHVMNLGGESERRRITEWAVLGKVAHEPVYCLRCGAGAALDSWVQSDALAEAGEPLPGLDKLTNVQMVAVAFRVNCEGARIVKTAVEYLRRYLDKRGVNP